MGKNHSRAPNIKQPVKSGPKLMRQAKNTTHQAQRKPQLNRQNSTSAIDLIRQHDALMFAVTLAVRLSILELMDVDGHSSNVFSMWSAFAKEDEKEEDCELVECVASETYISFMNRFGDIDTALDRIKSCPRIPHHAKATLVKLADSFSGDDLLPMFKSVNPNLYPLPNDYVEYSLAAPDAHTIFRDEGIKDYLVDYHSAEWKGQLDLCDLNINRVRYTLNHIESEPVDPKSFEYEAREIAKKLMEWVVEAKTTIALDQWRTQIAAWGWTRDDSSIPRFGDSEWPFGPRDLDIPCGVRVYLDRGFLCIC